MGSGLGRELKLKVYGIAYHSPLDVVTLVPDQTKVSLSPDESADVLFSQNVLDTTEIPVQIVFASPRLLLNKGIQIIDQGNNGQILNLNTLDWNKILN